MAACLESLRPRSAGAAPAYEELVDQVRAVLNRVSGHSGLCLPPRPTPAPVTADPASPVRPASAARAAAVAAAASAAARGSPLASLAIGSPSPVPVRLRSSPPRGAIPLPATHTPRLITATVYAPQHGVSEPPPASLPEPGRAFAGVVDASGHLVPHAPAMAATLPIVPLAALPAAPLAATAGRLMAARLGRPTRGDDAQTN